MWKRPIDPTALQGAADNLDVDVSKVYSIVAVELPDHPVARSYLNWAKQLQMQDDTVLPVVVTSPEDFAEAHGRGSVEHTLEALQKQGKPPLRPVRLFGEQHCDEPTQNVPEDNKKKRRS